MEDKKLFGDMKKGSVAIFIIAIFSAMIGFVMMATPLYAMKFLLLSLGPGMVVLGVMDFVRTLKLVNQLDCVGKGSRSPVKVLVILRGILGIVIGSIAVLLLIINFSLRREFVQTLEASFFLYFGIVSLIIFASLHDEGQGNEKAFYLIMGLISLAIGVLLFLLLFDVLAIIMMRIISIIFMVGGLAYSVYFIVVKVVDKKRG